MLSRIDSFVDHHRAEIYQVLMLGILAIWLSNIVHAVPTNPQPPEKKVWRMTNEGWELAHALPSSNSDGTVVEFPVRIIATPDMSEWIRIHRCILPVAIATLFATLLPWLLLHLPNQAVAPLRVRK